MTASVFGAEYSAAYDLLYQEKDYQAEVDLIERVFAIHGQDGVRRVLDLGCGTGGHAIPLAERGYQVVGVDRSPHMLERARARSKLPRFEVGEIGSLDLADQFDAVLMMFAVLGYQTTNADAAAALASVRRHLRPGGLFVCDLWYGPAVLRQRPSERVRVLDTSHGQVVRVAAGELDPRHNLCTVRYHLWQIQDERVTAEVREQHAMRYFFEPELDLLLDSANLELLRLGAFPDIDGQPSESTWNVACVARAV